MRVKLKVGNICIHILLLDGLALLATHSVYVFV